MNNINKKCTTTVNNNNRNNMHYLLKIKKEAGKQANKQTKTNKQVLIIHSTANCVKSTQFGTKDFADYIISWIMFIILLINFPFSQPTN